MSNFSSLKTSKSVSNLSKLAFYAQSTIPVISGRWFKDEHARARTHTHMQKQTRACTPSPSPQTPTHVHTDVRTHTDAGTHSQTHARSLKADTFSAHKVSKHGAFTTTETIGLIRDGTHTQFFPSFCLMPSDTKELIRDACKVG